MRKGEKQKEKDRIAQNESQQRNRARRALLDESESALAELLKKKELDSRPSVAAVTHELSEHWPYTVIRCPPGTAASDFVLYHGDKIACILTDLSGDRLWAETEITAFWRESDTEKAIPILLIYAHGKYKWLDLNGTDISNIRVNPNKTVEIYHVNFRPMDELKGHCERYATERGKRSHQS